MATSVLIGLAIGLHPRVILLLAGAFIAFAAAVIARFARADQLVLAAAALAALPFEFLHPLGPIGLYMPPAFSLMLLLLVTLTYRRGFVFPTLSVAVPALCLGTWIALSLLSSGAISSTTVATSAAFIVAFVMPPFISEALLDWSQVTRVLVLGGAAIAAYGCVEWVVQTNVVFGPLYTSGRVDSSGNTTFRLLQIWSQYRITTSLGPPLTNGAVFGALLVVAVGRAATSSASRRESSTVIPVLAIALLATQARGSLLGAGVGLSALVVFTPGAGMRVWSRIALLVTVAAAGSVSYAAVVTRSESNEGTVSASVRAYLPKLVHEVAQRDGPLGSGLANSAQRVAQLSIQTPSGFAGLESMYAQVAVSLGYVGLGLWALAWLLTVSRGLRSPQAAPTAAGALTVLVSVGTFISAENIRLVLFIGILLLLTEAALRSARPR